MPMGVPKMDPPVGQPGPPGPPNPTPPPAMKVDPNDFPEPESSDPRAKSLEAFAAIWERNVGSLDEMPEVKRALFDLVAGDGFDFDIKDGNGNSLWDFLKNGDGLGGDGSGFGDIFGDLGGGSGGSWFGNWEFPNMRSWFGGGDSSSSSSSSHWWNSSSSSRPPSSSGSGFGGGDWGIGGLGGSWLPFVLLALVILGVVIWFQLKNLQGRDAVVAVAGDGLGPWPVDPRAINTREDVVKAFEYLSVLICGPSARNWTHSTIAEALADLATTHGETAVMLARLYELARYAPLDEPLTHDEVLEARKLVCALAGVSY